MITRGSKFFYGAAAFLYLTALVYGFVTGASAHGGVLAVFSDGALVDSIIGPISFGWKGWVGDQIGYSVLMAAAGSLAVVGGLTSVFRDGSPEALAELQGATVERSVIQGDTLVDLRVASPQGLNVWPLVGAVSAGLLVTRSSREQDLPREFLRQLFARPQALAVTGGFLGLLVFTSLPKLPLLGLGAGCVTLAVTLSRRRSQAEVQAAALAQVKKPAEGRIEDYLAVDPMEIELGVNLIRLAEPKRGGDLLERVQRTQQAGATLRQFGCDCGRAPGALRTFPLLGGAER